MDKILATITAALCALFIQVDTSLAHHGWSWTTGDNIELIGIIREVSLGMPHGVLKVDAEGDVRTVDVGQPRMTSTACDRGTAVMAL